MKKNIVIVILSIMLLVTISSLVILLNTEYKIKINGITYKQKIIDYITEQG